MKGTRGPALLLTEMTGNANSSSARYRTVAGRLRAWALWALELLPREGATCLARQLLDERGVPAACPAAPALHHEIVKHMHLGPLGSREVGVRVGIVAKGQLVRRGVERVPEALVARLPRALVPAQPRGGGGMGEEPVRRIEPLERGR